MLRNSDILALAGRLVSEANDPGECADFGRAVKYILEELAGLAKDGSLANKLRAIAADVRYPLLSGLASASDIDDIPDKPDEGDYIISDCGPLGSLSQVSIVNGRFLGQFPDFDSAMAAIKANMEKEAFWPNVWSESGHGNLSLVTDELPD